ncbi:MAG: DNA replication complex GINS family protein [Desulfurococcales archaeon]|nr:DNA replication complex GINS family protein [Desulfurococcales archaeon]
MPDGGSLELRLRLIVMDYEMRPVRVLALKDIGPLPLPQGIVNIRRGDELEMPRWQARILSEEGAVEIRERALDIDTINMYHYREKRGQAANQLQGLPQDFYMAARDLIVKLNEMIRESPSTMLIRDREVLEKNLIDLAETRLSKIIRLAVSGGEEFKERMTPEEGIVYDRLRGVVEAWRRYAREIAGGGSGERG